MLVVFRMKRLLNSFLYTFSYRNVHLISYDFIITKKPWLIVKRNYTALKDFSEEFSLTESMEN